MITRVDKGHPVSVVAFSGLAPRNSMFEWVQTFNLLACNFVGVRDPANDWYQTHKDAIAEQVMDATRDKIRMFIGASAGGFAALWFGRMLEADVVLAISPQSACGETKRRLGDERWPNYCEHTPDCDIGGSHPNATVHYAMNDELDVMHAMRLVCRHKSHPSGGHNLPDVMKRQGIIGDVIVAALERSA